MLAVNCNASTRPAGAEAHPFEGSLVLGGRMRRLFLTLMTPIRLRRDRCIPNAF